MIVTLGFISFSFIGFVVLILGLAFSVYIPEEYNKTPLLCYLGYLTFMTIGVVLLILNGNIVHWGYFISAIGLPLIPAIWNLKKSSDELWIAAGFLMIIGNLAFSYNNLNYWYIPVIGGLLESLYIAYYANRSGKGNRLICVTVISLIVFIIVTPILELMFKNL
jgi:hypothetical protein